MIGCLFIFISKIVGATKFFFFLTNLTSKFINFFRMKLISLNNYCFISIIILATQLRKALRDTTDLYDISIKIFEDKKLYLSLINCLTCILIILSIFALDTFIGKLSHTEKSSIINALYKRGMHLVLSLSFNFGLDFIEIHDVLKPYFTLFLMFYVRERVHNLQLKPKLPTFSEHYRLFCSQFALFFMSIYQTFQWFKSVHTKGHANQLVLTTDIFYATFGFLLDIFNHMIFMSDRENLGGSNLSFHLSILCEYGCNIVMLICQLLVLIIVIRSIESGFVNFFPVIIQVVLEMKKTISKHRRWKHMISALQSVLPDVDENDLKKDDTCIVCRAEMTPKDAKRLPCGHCIHTECLEKWTKDHTICPLCQNDMAQLLANAGKIADNKAKEEEINPNVI